VYKKYIFLFVALQCNDMLFVLQLLRKSYSELKLLEGMNWSEAGEGRHNDSAHEASGLAASSHQHELIEKVLKNVALVAEVL